jgi:hypothetical protein
MPCVARAIRSAVAGATTMQSASWPSRTCGTRSTDSQTLVATGLPERADHVAAPTKLRDAAVGTTVTSQPDSASPRRTSAAL